MPLQAAVVALPGQLMPMASPLMMQPLLKPQWQTVEQTVVVPNLALVAQAKHADTAPTQLHALTT